MSFGALDYLQGGHGDSRNATSKIGFVALGIDREGYKERLDEWRSHAFYSKSLESSAKRNEGGGRISGS